MTFWRASRGLASCLRQSAPAQQEGPEGLGKGSRSSVGSVGRWWLRPRTSRSYLEREDILELKSVGRLTRNSNSCGLVLLGKPPIGQADKVWLEMADRFNEELWDVNVVFASHGHVEEGGSTTDDVLESQPLDELRLDHQAVSAINRLQTGKPKLAKVLERRGETLGLSGSPGPKHKLRRRSRVG